MKSITYKSAGVDIKEGERFVNLIKPLAGTTIRKEVLAGIGGFNALFAPDVTKYQNPVLVSSTDGVGTKLKIAFMLDKHDTVGIDLVAMAVNDIIVSGAEPLFFLDYFAAGRLNAKKAAQVIKGVAKGCREAECSLVGGETAEMPGFYNDGEYDLAGFAVGIVERDRIIDGSGIKAGDRIIGLASSGLHSNGFSLARKVIFDGLKLKCKSRINGLKKTVGEELLTPTRIYVRAIKTILKNFRIKGIAHITGGGLTGNIPRILPRGIKAVIERKKWDMPFIFRFIQDAGKISPGEMFRTFNCGIGMAIIVDRNDEGRIMQKLRQINQTAYIISEVENRKKDEESLLIV
ncbi:MAG: phosphoribosylformylglycinamidine cyclo-ligase [Deltaproteobacteria bacterium GWC2_42_11]|nr:MAG: phosphoribosylformylglycinamidine cyclo-ligase [Deltaproteobacteria bacterium GWC2_42_11]HBO84049.1 phosphoribosylformylglycinamidine cyclo-ligase [Deltaproteobacteria bacterium]